MNNMKAKPQLSVSEALNEAKRKLTQLNGRSRRSEYWWTALVLGVCGWFLGFIPIVGSIITLAVSLIMIPLGVRRLHDSGHSGKWYAACMIVGFCTGAIYFYKIIPILDKYADNAEKLIRKLGEVYADPLVICSMLASFVLGIIVLVFLCQDSKPEPNKWGVSPKYGPGEDDIEVIE